jgi:hypothetical protein
MPLFVLDDLGTADGRWWTAHRVQATMLFPDDGAERSGYMAAVAGFCLLHPARPGTAASAGADEPTGRRVPVSRRAAAAILEQHGGPPAALARSFAFYQDQIRRAQGRWCMAGGLLTMLLGLSRHDEFRKRASVNLAAHVLEQEQPFPGVMAANRKDIFEAWRRYKPVAHFCGAVLNLHLHAPRAGGDDDERTAFVRDRLFAQTREFLEEAAFYQSFGLSYRLPRTKGRTPLEPDALHRVAPPPDQEAGELTVLPLSDRLADIARRYRAPKRLEA